MRFVKWILIVFVLVPLVLLLALWGMLEFAPQQKIRMVIAQELTRRLGRQVELGPLHLTWKGLGIDTLRLSEAPNFRAGTFLTAKGVRLGWEPRSLWLGLDLKKKFITRSSGAIQINDFQNPHYTARDFSVRWSLSNMDPTWSRLNGWMKLNQGAGSLQNIDRLMATSATVKAALAPVVALMNLESAGILTLGLPDLRHWPIHSVHGEYTFKNGRMTIERFTIDSSRLALVTTGAVNLANGNLLLDVQLHGPRSGGAGALDAKLSVSGTISHPKVDLNSLKKKAFRATVTHLLENQL